MMSFWELIKEPSVFIAVVSVVAGGIGYVFRPWVDRYLHPRVDKPCGVFLRFSVDLIIDSEDSVDMCVVTFKLNTGPNAMEKWIPDRNVGLKQQGSSHEGKVHFTIDADKIARELEEPSNPFKPYLVVPTTKRLTYCGRLCQESCIVTGSGDQVPDNPEKWRIWFLFPQGNLHPDQVVYSLNHAL